MNSTSKHLRLFPFALWALAFILVIGSACANPSSITNGSGGEEEHQHEDEGHEDEHMEEHEVERTLNNGAMIRILAPSDGSTFNANEDVFLEIEVENFVLGDGDGHWHIYIDGVSLGMIMGGKTDAILNGLELGEHEVEVHLSQFTHVELQDGDSIHIFIDEAE